VAEPQIDASRATMGTVVEDGKPFTVKATVERIS